MADTTNTQVAPQEDHAFALSTDPVSMQNALELTLPRRPRRLPRRLPGAPRSHRAGPRSPTIRGMPPRAAECRTLMCCEVLLTEQLTECLTGCPLAGTTPPRPPEPRLRDAKRPTPSAETVPEHFLGDPTKIRPSWPSLSRRPPVSIMTTITHADSRSRPSIPTPIAIPTKDTVYPPYRINPCGLMDGPERNSFKEDTDSNESNQPIVSRTISRVQTVIAL